MIRFAAAIWLACAGVVAAQVAEPEGFRGEPYRAPVPDTLAGARVVSPEQALALHDQGAAFLDVLPRKRRPDDLPKDTVWREPQHMTIPGALWLWDTGYQDLAPAEQSRLENGLSKATGNDKSAPLVIFCRADCWMSWNAAKRAVGLGYQAVHWYPQGTDGWETALGRDLVTAQPVDP